MGLTYNPGFAPISINFAPIDFLFYLYLSFLYYIFFQLPYPLLTPLFDVRTIHPPKSLYPSNINIPH